MAKNSTSTVVSKKPTPKAKKKAKADGISVHADLPQREPRWNPSRLAVVKAMKALGAGDPSSAKTATQISAKCGVDVKKVKIHLDVYRVTELLHNGYAKSVRTEGSRELSYYLTEKGRKLDVAAKAKEVAKKASE
jgi:predicted transcriptional regulator